MRERAKDIDRLYHIEESIGPMLEMIRMQGKAPGAWGKHVFMALHKGMDGFMSDEHYRKEEHPEVPWRNIIDMRNVLVHGYYLASPLFIWETYTKDLGPLLEQVKRYITELQ